MAKANTNNTPATADNKDKKTGKKWGWGFAFGTLFVILAIWVYLNIPNPNASKTQPTTAATASSTAPTTGTATAATVSGLFVRQSADDNRPVTGAFVWKAEKPTTSQTTPRKLKVGALLIAKPVDEGGQTYDVSSLTGWAPEIEDTDSIVLIVNRVDDDQGRAYLLYGPTSTYYELDSEEKIQKNPARIVPSPGNGILTVCFLSASQKPVAVKIVRH